MFQPVFPLALVANYFNVEVSVIINWISSGQLHAYRVNGTCDFVVPLVALVRRMKFMAITIPEEVHELYTGRILLVSDDELYGTNLASYVDQNRIQVRRVSPRDEPDVSFRPDLVLLDLDYKELNHLQRWVDAMRKDCNVVPHFIQFEVSPGPDDRQLNHVYETSGGWHFFSDNNCARLSDETLRRKYRICHRIIDSSLAAFKWTNCVDWKTSHEIQVVFRIDDFARWIRKSKQWVKDNIDSGSTFAHPVVGTKKYLVPSDQLRERMNEMMLHVFPASLEHAQTGNILVVSDAKELLNLFDDVDNEEVTLPYRICKDGTLRYRIWQVSPTDSWPKPMDCVVIDCNIGDDLVHEWINRLNADDISHPPSLIAVCLDPGHPLVRHFVSCLTLDGVGRDLVHDATLATMRRRYDL